MGEKVMSKEYMPGDFFEKYMEENDIAIYFADRSSREAEEMVANMSVHSRCNVDLNEARESVDEIERLVYDEKSADRISNFSEEKSSRDLVDRQAPTVDRQNLCDKRVNRLSLPGFEKEQSSSTLEHVRKTHLNPPLAHPEAAVGVSRKEVQKMMSEENLPSDFYTTQSAIKLPPLEGVDFVLKNSSIALASEKPFYGGPEENPFYHIESFDLLIDSIKKNGVTEDWLSCKLFPYTLRRDGAKWLRNLPAGSLTSWKDVRGKFLNHFYTEEMTDIVRAKIFGFQQGDCETFREAWERFNELTRSCPHHGFTLERIVIMFYRGLKWDFKSALDAINGGHFMEQYPEDGIDMIKKFSRSGSGNHRREKKHESLTLVEAQTLADIKKMALELLHHEKVAAPIEKDKSMEETKNSTAQTYKDMSVLEATLGTKHDRFAVEELRRAIEQEEFEDEENSPENESTDSPQQSADWDPKPSKEKSPENESTDCPEESTDWKSKSSGEQFAQPTVNRQGKEVDRLSAPEFEILKDSSAPERIYKPQIPYPRAAMRYNDSLEEIISQVPSVHEFRDVPCVKNIVDKVFSDEVSLDDAADMIDVECATIPRVDIDPEVATGYERVFNSGEEEKMIVKHELTTTSITPATALKQKAPNTTLQPLPKAMQCSPHELNSKPSTLVEYLVGVLSIVGLLALIFFAYFSMISNASFGVLDPPFSRVHHEDVLTIPLAVYLLDPAVTYAVYSKGPRPP